MFHHFDTDISGIALPELFTYPFCYRPHPLTEIAARQVQAYLDRRTDWKEEIGEGKMFGVMVVKNEAGETGFLAAFSGNIAHSNHHEYFVPPIYDLLQPDGFFRIEENNISEINRKIAQTEQSAELASLQRQLADARQQAEQELADFTAQMKVNKQHREAVRASNPTDEMLAQLVRESQFEKAELRRTKIRLNEGIARLQQQIDGIHNRLHSLKTERKQRSAALQRRLFDCFQVLNAHGERRGICGIFEETRHELPPAGTGECAAPKLLQYAYLHQLTPLAMGEFWWGKSPKTEVRRHLHYYPACHSKCEPLLGFMLQGLNVEPNPLDKGSEQTVTTVYEDDWLWVVNKPEGMLSVPGKDGTLSAEERLLRLRPDLHGLYPVHRLDMATSGVLLFAKSPDIQSALHRQFRERRVEKRYIALLDGTLHTPSGTISLPLRPDYTNRPRQTVDYAHGKEAETRYRTLGTYEDKTLVEFIPLTGRTHQLRIHAAHPDGLNAPICGDTLYGHTPVASSIASTHIRLCLHALTLRLDHPVTSMPLTITSRHNLFPIPGFTL